MNNKIYPWLHRSWEALQSKLERMPHALLIHGPQGVGKRLLAERFAQSVLCEAGDRRKAPCGACAGCRWVEAGSHPDLRLVEPEALARAPVAEEEAAPAPRATKPSIEIKVDQVRGLDDFLNLNSHRGGPRVALIHPAEAMNPNAANALLKGLEEPPGQAMFILVSHRPARLLATIRSRCVALPVPVPDTATAVAWLKQQDAGDAGAQLAFASGSPLRALQYASEAGEAANRLRAALGFRDMDALSAVSDRDQLEALAEVLQKHALDRAFRAYGGRPRYGVAVDTRQGAAWLRYARRLGRDRALARHPLNPRLFASEMLRGMPTE